jgi:hypothetical protein
MLLLMLARLQPLQWKIPWSSDSMCDS